MTAKMFSRGRADGSPSTQFAATIVAMPGLADDAPLGADAPNPDTFAPDSVVTDASGANAAVPDVVTGFGGLPGELPDPADAPTLSHIGRYAPKRQLGAGGLGAVFEAWDPLLSRAVAVKTLQFDMDLAARVSLDGLFLNEARAAASLSHRYIVTIHDAGLSAHGVYIAMERLYGRDLQCALADGWRPSIDQAVQLVRRIAEALAYAHSHGVVHCDIKPANIFLQRRDRPKVLDFGIARIVHGGALPALDGAVLGSPRYRAPEQLTGAGIDARTDLFSLGVVMHELLTGRRAFGGGTLADINRAVQDDDLPSVHQIDPSIPLDLSAMVARLVARAPADRYTCASELGSDLRRWLHSRQAPAVAVVAAGPAAASTRTRRSTPTAWMLGAGACWRPRRWAWRWWTGGGAAPCDCSAIHSGPPTMPALAVTPAATAPETAATPAVPTPLDPAPATVAAVAAVATAPPAPTRPGTTRSDSAALRARAPVATANDLRASKREDSSAVAPRWPLPRPTATCSWLSRPGARSMSMVWRKAPRHR
ncbi:MAG: serine/threonine protein kinase [Rubrivivax sp.]|nr:serine/threonine protein kinase [Rubrivivax sp.]